MMAAILSSDSESAEQSSQQPSGDDSSVAATTGQPEVRTESDPDRLARLMAGIASGPIDHTKCEHDANDTERRRCRREKLKGAIDKASVFPIIDGVRYIPDVLVRAESLRVAAQQSWCSDGLNQTFNLLDLPPTNRNGATTNNTARQFDVVFELTSYNTNTIMANETQVRRVMSGMHRDYSSIFRGTTLSYRQVTRTKVMFEGEQEISRETYTEPIAQIRITGQYRFSFPREQHERRIGDVQHYFASFVQHYLSAKIVRTESLTVTDPEVTVTWVDDDKLLNVYNSLRQRA